MRKIVIVLSLIAFLASASPGIAATTVNLISNPSVEQASTAQYSPMFFSKPAGWNKVDDSRNVTFFSYPVAGYNSQKAVKVQVISYKQNKEGWDFTNVNVDPTQQYTFSDYYVSTAPSYISVTPSAFITTVADGSLKV